MFYDTILRKTWIPWIYYKSSRLGIIMTFKWVWFRFNSMYGDATLHSRFSWNYINALAICLISHIYTLHRLQFRGVLISNVDVCNLRFTTIVSGLTDFKRRFTNPWTITLSQGVLTSNVDFPTPGLLPSLGT